MLDERLAICRSCPLYKETSSYGPICDNTKFINPDGKQWSYTNREGWVRGCGCHLKHKAANPKNHCIVKKW